MRAEPNFGLAQRQVLGHRPDVVKWTPSKGLPWWIGTWREDHRFTVEQERVLIELARDPVTASAITVSREACPRAEVGGMLRQWLPVYQFDCPVLAHRADGKITIIAPDGSRRNIRGDGWATKPSSWPYMGERGFS